MEKRYFAAFLGVLFSISALAVADTRVAGKKGGRLLEVDGINAEFFIEKDHTVTISFYNEKLEQVPASSQTATLTAEAPSGKKKIEFENRNGSLASKAPLPEGHGYNLVVQMKKNEKSKVKNFRIPFETAMCGECGNAEYACTCEGH